jgi:hypothetical protein
LDLKEKQGKYDSTIDFNMVDDAIIDVYKRLCNCDDYSAFIKN